MPDVSACKHCASLVEVIVKIVFYALKRGGNITNQCAVGELKRCELIHTFSLQLIHFLHTMELKVIPRNSHLVRYVDSELIITV